MSAVLKQPLSGIVDGISNDDYHNSPGISKSGLDMIRKSPASYIWQSTAPTDDDKTKALDFGTAFHCLLLEPDEFTNRYVIEPAINKRTDAGKEEAAAFAESVKDLGQTIISDNDLKKLKLMRGSVFSHPTARELMSMNGVAEHSVFWTDEETGASCRCRPDWLVEDKKIIVDLKTAADFSRIQRAFEDYRYFVQDPFYRAGLKAVTGDDYDFLFIFVSTSINCGRYPVDVIRLNDAARFDGETHMKADLQKYIDCQNNDDWQSITEIDRPNWATRNEEQIL
jgi:hypothetical protein